MVETMVREGLGSVVSTCRHDGEEILCHMNAPENNTKGGQSTL